VDKGAVVLQVQADQFEILHLAEDRRHHLARHAVGGIHDHLDRSAVGLEELQDVLAVFLIQVAMLDRTFRFTESMQQGRGNMLDVLEASVGANGLGLLAGNLEAIVGSRIVRSGNLHAAAGAEMIDRKIHLRRVDHADVDHVGPGRVHPLDQGLGQRGTVLTHIMAHAQALGIGQPALVTPQHRTEKLGRRVSDLPGGFFIQLLLVQSSNIIGLEYAAIKIHLHILPCLCRNIG